MKALTWLLLVVGAAITIGKMIQSAGGDLSAGSFAFMAWAISPFVVFGLAAFLVGKFTKIADVWVVSFVVALVMVLFTAYVYLMGMDGTSSTEALAFVVVPIYLYVGALVLFGVGLLLAKLLGRYDQN